MEITKDTGRVLFGFVSLFYNVGGIDISCSLDMPLSTLNNYKRGHTKVKPELLSRVYEIYPKVEELMKIYHDQMMLKPKFSDDDKNKIALEIMVNNQAMIISLIEMILKYLNEKGE